MNKCRPGLFIHWGIYAIPGGQEQHRLRLKTPQAEYAKLAAFWWDSGNEIGLPACPASFM